MTSGAPLIVKATPYEYEFSPEHAALLVIDMQRDFVEPGGFGEVPGKMSHRCRPSLSHYGWSWPPRARLASQSFIREKGTSRTSPIARRASCRGDGFLGASATQVQMAASSSEVNAATTSSTNSRRSPRSR